MNKYIPLICGIACFLFVLQFITTGLGLSFKSCRLDLAYLIPAGSSTTSTMSNTFKTGFSFLIK
jgi:hypothetical protein